MITKQCKYIQKHHSPIRSLKYLKKQRKVSANYGEDRFAHFHLYVSYPLLSVVYLPLHIVKE